MINQTNECLKFDTRTNKYIFVQYRERTIVCYAVLQEDSRRRSKLMSSNWI